MDHWQTGKKNKFDRVLNLLNFFPHLWNKTKRYWLGVSKLDENWRIVPEYRIVRESYLIWGKLILVICSLPSLGSTRRRLEVRIRTHPGVLTDMWVKSTTTHTRTTEGRWVLNWGEPEVKDPETNSRLRFHSSTPNCENSGVSSPGKETEKGRWRRSPGKTDKEEGFPSGFTITVFTPGWKVVE